MTPTATINQRNNRHLLDPNGDTSATAWQGSHGHRWFAHQALASDPTMRSAIALERVRTPDGTARLC